ERAAHRMKGASGNVSGRRVAALADRLETIARDGDLPLAEAITRDLESEIARLNQALAQFLAENAACEF
ncbi:MAG TPA: Hpt domain-containing protein, partial [Pirellulales bacterium]